MSDDQPVRIVRVVTANTQSQDLLALPLGQARIEFERIYFLELLAMKDGKVRDVSTHSGMERTHVYRKLHDLGLRQQRRGS